MGRRRFGRGMKGDVLARQIVDDLFGGSVATLRQSGGVVGQRVDLVAQLERALERCLLVQQDGRIIDALAHQLHRLKHHGREKTQRQERQGQLERRLAWARQHRIAHRVLLVAVAGAGRSPCRSIMAISAWSLVAATAASRLCTRASPIALYCGPSAMNCWRAATSVWVCALNSASAILTATSRTLLPASQTPPQASQRVCRSVIMRYLLIGGLGGEAAKRPST